MQDAKALASVIGEDELSESDKRVMAFGKAFDERFLGQGNVGRSVEETLDLGWELLRMMPRNELDRVDDAILDEFYNKA